MDTYNDVLQFLILYCMLNIQSLLITISEYNQIEITLKTMNKSTTNQVEVTPNSDRYTFFVLFLVIILFYIYNNHLSKCIHTYIYIHTQIYIYIY